MFLVYLYQRWLYPVDYTRINEFGEGGDEKEKKNKEKLEPEVEEKSNTTEQDESGTIKRRTARKT